MERVNWTDFLEESPFNQKKISMTLGVFDGLHPGHRLLISRLKENPDFLPVVFTFRINPALITRPKVFKGNILTLEQKLERMDKLGVKAAVIIDFSHDFSKLTGKNFFSLIRERSLLSRVVLGENHRLGHKGETGAEDTRVFLEKSGIGVFIEDSILIDDSPVSSTRIRNEIISGDFKKAEKLLGTGHVIDIRRLPNENENGRIKIKKKDIMQVLPPDGIYRGEIEINQELFATKIILDKDYIKWDQKNVVPAEKITMSNFEKEET